MKEKIFIISKHHKSKEPNYLKHGTRMIWFLKPEIELEFHNQIDYYHF